MGRGVGGFLACLALAHAHDPFEITTTARLQPAALVLDLTMARSTAMAIAAGTKEAPTFDPAEFERHRARFAARAVTLFAIASGGAPLAAPRVELSLSVEQDVEFHLVYARPAQSPLRFTATHVVNLGYGYGNVLTVQGDRGALLGQQLLTAESPTLEVTLPAPPATPVAAPPSARSFSWPAAALALVLVGGLWRWRRVAAA